MSTSISVSQSLSEDPIAEDGDYGPETDSRLGMSPADGFPLGACTTTMTPDAGPVDASGRVDANTPVDASAALDSPGSGDGNLNADGHGTDATAAATVAGGCSVTRTRNTGLAAPLLILLLSLPTLRRRAPR
jgi:hypothetical protein